MLQNCTAKKHSFALKNTAEFKAKIIEHDFLNAIANRWIETWVDWLEISMHPICWQCMHVHNTGENIDQSLSALSAVEPVSGRFNVVSGSHPVRAIVDYAHTPDALQHVLETINKIRTGNEILITVFGCGGGRDKAKRPLMGKIASTLSDKVIFTSDNPRMKIQKRLSSKSKLVFQQSILKNTSAFQVDHKRSKPPVNLHIKGISSCWQVRGMKPIKMSRENDWRLTIQGS
ncbi:MAG: hypothetical protein CM15mP59_2010 [Flavobacteriaceae bacterium]|nr:MAG: hypothetical protein CM15mP59_2010 [Flavobacteriaceae bacterium]